MKAIVVCEQCGKEYQVKPSRVLKTRFCSRACFAAWRSENVRGEKVHSWRGGKVVVNCKQCGKEFKVPSYKLKVGRGKFCSKDCLSTWMSENMSGENSPNYTSEKVACPICGTEFDRAPWEVKDGRGIYCSEKCYGLSRPPKIEREKHPRWQGDDEVRECAICGEGFAVRPFSQQKTCGSRECIDALRIPKISGENHYNWHGGPEVRVCEWCGDEYETYQASPQRFCGQKCMGEYFSKYRSGENHPCFNPDKEDRIYPPEFNKRFKTKIRKRDGYSCAICRLYGHEVHHINYDKMCSEEWNLITLCPSCHGTTNVNRDYWQPTLTALITARSLSLPPCHFT